MQDCSGTWGGDAVENEYCLDLDGDGQGDMDTLEWFCSDDVGNGFIEDDDKALKKYKKDHQQEWKEILGGSNFELIEEEEEVTVSETTTSTPTEPN